MATGTHEPTKIEKQTCAQNNGSHEKMQYESIAKMKKRANSIFN